MSTEPPLNPAGHRSTLAAHPDVKDLLPRFIGRLPEQVGQLRAALAAGDRATLQRLIHQCRGAGRSYGFAPISQHAADAEEALLAGAALPAVEPMVRRLVAYIEEIEGYGQSPPPGDPAGGAAGVSR
jgi:HPt (histidine-containing phosphotransfer) domain-containing protein